MKHKMVWENLLFVQDTENEKERNRTRNSSVYISYYLLYVTISCTKWLVALSSTKTEK